MAQALHLPSVRKDFPALAQEVSGYPLAYLDNASTTQKPLVVADAVRQMYLEDCANIYRGVHTLSHRATTRFEAVREAVCRFLGGVALEEVVFVRGTTEAINLVAASYGRSHVGAGDEVLVSELEHHANIVPWQMLVQAQGARLRVLPIDERGRLRLESLTEVLRPNTRIVALSHVSNSLGTLTDIRAVARAAHQVGAVVVVDGAQAAPHLPLQLSELGADFYAFSGHKMYGPPGAGVLWGRRDLLEAMPPWQGGGEMIGSVSFTEGTSFNRLPYKFEAGTPDIAAVVGLGAAIDYIESLGRAAIAAHETKLLAQATAALEVIEGVRIIGTAPDKVAVLSFVLDEVHAHDAGTVLDTLGIAVRTGQHCAEPVMDRLGVPATVRASFALYNTSEEVDRLVEGVKRVLHMFRRSG